ncbi:hypothetical protein ACQEU3_46655 [Spirillospora sp. CA-253888]
MTAPDPLAVRAYQLIRDEHTRQAEATIRGIKAKAADLDPANALSLGTAQRLATDVTELIRHLSALRAVNELSFLIEGEAPR